MAKTGLEPTTWCREASRESIAIDFISPCIAIDRWVHRRRESRSQIAEQIPEPRNLGSGERAISWGAFIPRDRFPHASGSTDGCIGGERADCKSQSRFQNHGILVHASERFLGAHSFIAINRWGASEAREQVADHRADSRTAESRPSYFKRESRRAHRDVDESTAALWCRIGTDPASAIHYDFDRGGGLLKLSKLLVLEDALLIGP
jgi:hypothetical protein